MYGQSLQNTVPVNGSPSVGAVNITIKNPTVSPQQQLPYQQPAYTPVYYPIMSAYYPNINNCRPIGAQSMQTPGSNVMPDNTKIKSSNPEEVKDLSNTSGEVKNIASHEDKEDQQALAAKPMVDDKNVNKNESKKMAPVPPLSNELIKELENDLSDTDEVQRGKAVTKIINLLKADDNRKNDLALNNLLNKALRDKKSPNVRFMALNAFVNGTATGTPESLLILKSMSNVKDTYGNQELADKALNKLSEKISNFSATSATPINEKRNDSISKIGEKLNLVSS